MSQAYIDYTFPFRERFYDLVTEFRGDVKVLRNRAKNPVGKVLFVIDHIPTEDLTSGKLLSGYLDSVFFELCHVAYDYYQAEYSIEELDYMVVNFNCFKTYGKSEDFKNEYIYHFQILINEKEF